MSARTRSERKLAWMLCAPAVLAMLAVTAYPIGYAIALYPSSTLFAAARSAREVAAILKRDGTTREELDRLLPFGELNQTVGLAAWQAEEERSTG